MVFWVLGMKYQELSSVTEVVGLLVLRSSAHTRYIYCIVPGDVSRPVFSLSLWSTFNTGSV